MALKQNNYLNHFFFRYACNICQMVNISHARMVEHITSEHGELKSDSIKTIPENVQIEMWVRKVIEVQKKIMAEDEPLLVPMNTCIEDNTTDGGMEMKSNKKNVTCTICNIR